MNPQAARTAGSMDRAPSKSLGSPPFYGRISWGPAYFHRDTFPPRSRFRVSANSLLRLPPTWG